MSENPHTPSEVSATIKNTGNRDAAWLVFRGTPEAVKENIALSFGMDCASVAERTLYDVVCEAEATAHGVSHARQSLGGKVLSKGESASNGAQKASESPSSGSEQSSNGENPLITAVNNCKTVKELQTLWAENQAAFADDTLMAAYKSRGKSLTAAK